MQTVLDIDLTRGAELGNRILPELDRLRQEAPIMWSKAANAWIISGHENVVKAFSGELPFSNERYSSFVFSSIPKEEFATRLPTLCTTIPHWIVNLDPPRHTRLRKLMTRAFSRKTIEDMRPFARQTIAHVLDSTPTGVAIEFVDAVARAITGRVILRMFGLPESYVANFENWSLALNSTFGAPQPTAADLDAAERALREMRAALLPEIEARRQHPTEDFLTQLVQARDGADQLGEEEVMGICYVSLIAGHDTTMNSMSLGTELLSRNPEQVTHILENPDSIVNSVIEITRLSAMSTAQPRVVGADFEWQGQKLRKGDTAFIMVASANRDPAVFAAPLKLDLSRDSEQVMTFGPGLHHCIGHLLAKMQLSEFFPALFRRFNVEMLDPELHFTPPIAFRGLETLPVRLTRRHG
jgi:pimeloyl-[acyl-carrier protein] synthase